MLFAAVNGQFKKITKCKKISVRINNYINSPKLTTPENILCNQGSLGSISWLQPFNESFIIIFLYILTIHTFFLCQLLRNYLFTYLNVKKIWE